jgi:hypothetical protein
MRGLKFWARDQGPPGIGLRSLAGFCLTLILIPSVFAKDQAQTDTHIRIIRGLGREVAVSKVPLPRGKKGVRVDSQGKLDKADADAQISSHGLGIKPGMPVEITKISFKSNEIVFELNGGGKGGGKWYQHIEIGMGVPVTPVSQQSAVTTYGSSVTLRFPGKLPNLSVEQVKQMLGAVLDFTHHSPTTQYSPEVPPKFKEAIKNHQVLVGMDRDAVLSAKGAPDRRVREEREGVEQEDWIYGSPPHVLFVTFDGDSVIQVHQY